jgi:hypothetical protein
VDRIAAVESVLRSIMKAAAAAHRCASAKLRRLREPQEAIRATTRTGSDGAYPTKVEVVTNDRGIVLPKIAVAFCDFRQVRLGLVLDMT